MRSAVLIFLASLAFATTQAHAQSKALKGSMVGAICSRQADPAATTARLASRLDLTDPQKSALREMADAFASADASAKKLLCSDDQPDLSTIPGRMAFAEKMAEIRLAGLKAIEPKLQAFYDTLDARQKRAFNTGGRIGGIFNWWSKT